MVRLGPSPGTWEISEHVPTAVQRLAPSEEEKEARERAEAAAPAAEDPGEEPELGTAMLATPPTIIMAAEPTELIVTEGAPEYNPSALIFSMSTTVKATCSSRSRPSVTSFYCLGAGSRRPDSTVPEPSSLPESFQAIPEDSAVGHLRVWVSGTDKVNEAVLDASIPQTAAIPRDATTRSSMTFYKIDKRVSSEVSRPIARRAARLEGAVFVVLSFVCLVHFCAGHGVTRGKRSRFHTRSVSRGDLARHIKCP